MKQLQKVIIANREKRCFPSASDLSKTTCGFAEEVGEFEKARREDDRDAMVDALCDIMVYCLGGFEILERDALAEVRKVVRVNEDRVTQKPH